MLTSKSPTRWTRVGYVIGSSLGCSLGCLVILVKLAIVGILIYGAWQYFT